MEYQKLCDVCERLQNTPKRLEKTRILADFLKSCPGSELEPITLLIQGLVYPAWDEHKLGFSSSYIVKALTLVSGLSADSIKDLWRETGDLGECALQLRAKKQQKTLYSQKLTVQKVFTNIRNLAETEGKGSVDTKIQLVTELLSSASGIEAKFIVRTVLDELRIGLGEGVLRDALVWAFLPKVIGISAEGDKSAPRTLVVETVEKLKTSNLSNYDFIYAEDTKNAREVYKKMVARVQRALDVCNDFGTVARTLKDSGYGALKKIALQSGRPLKAMLALKEDSIAAGFERVGTPAALEYKLDGFRLQIHKSNKGIALFTRRLENVTAQFPDVAEAVRQQILGDSFILDAEVVGIDPKTGKFLPFQSISQRIKRKYDIPHMSKEFPVQVHVFDIVYYDDKDLLKTPFAQRRDIIEKIIKRSPKINAINHSRTSSESDAEIFYKNSIAAGNEGIMMKKLDAPYKPGARVGYMVKLKSTMETLDLVIVGAEWGEGKRSTWLSSYICACRNQNTGELSIVGRVSTGLKEKPEEGLSFTDLTRELRPLIVKQQGREVTVKPKIVIEVNYEEVQKSPTYTSGFALRFPRVVRLRADRDEMTCSTLSDVKRLFESQK